MLKKNHIFSKNPKVLKNIIFSKKIKTKSSLFLNIRNMQFDQSSPVQPNPEKKSRKSQKLTFFKKSEKF